MYGSNYQVDLKVTHRINNDNVLCYFEKYLE